MDARAAGGRQAAAAHTRAAARRPCFIFHACCDAVSRPLPHGCKVNSSRTLKVQKGGAGRCRFRRRPRRRRAAHHDISHFPQGFQQLNAAHRISLSRVFSTPKLRFPRWQLSQSSVARRQSGPSVSTGQQGHAHTHRGRRSACAIARGKGCGELRRADARPRRKVPAAAGPPSPRGLKLALHPQRPKFILLAAGVNHTA